MRVNDNVKGYCHAWLVTQNALPIWKQADHEVKESRETRRYATLSPCWREERDAATCLVDIRAA